MTASLFQSQNLSKSYAQGGPVLSGLNWQMQAGSFSVLMGRSGAGKSTLLKILTGLEPLSEGTLIFQGQSMQEASETDWALFRRQHIGIVFQDHNLIPYLSLLENVILAGQLAPQKRTVIRERAMSLFIQLEIAELADRLPTEVSGGERQRAAIARALINQPEILVADEPTGSLNASSSQKVMDIFQMLHQQGQSILLATHDLQAALYGTEVWFLQDGQNLLRWEETPNREQADALFQWLSQQGW